MYRGPLNFSNFQTYFLPEVPEGSVLIQVFRLELFFDEPRDAL